MKIEIEEIRKVGKGGCFFGVKAVIYINGESFESVFDIEGDTFSSVVFREGSIPGLSDAQLFGLIEAVKSFHKERASEEQEDEFSRLLNNAYSECGERVKERKQKEKKRGKILAWVIVIIFILFFLFFLGGGYL